MLKISHYIFIYLGIPVLVYTIILISGDISWYYGNLFVLITILSAYFTSTYLLIYNNGLLLERFNFKSSDQETKDKSFIGNIGIYLFILYYIVLPLSYRYSILGHFNHQLQIISMVLLLKGYAMIFLVFKQNSYASPIIRNQKERNHKIISTGLYGYVRHPMYTGFVLILIFSPLMLNSLLGLILGMYMSYIFCKRINIEEDFLMKEFVEYKNYKNKVKYKILPFVY